MKGPKHWKPWWGLAVGWASAAINYGVGTWSILDPRNGWARPVGLINLAFAGFIVFMTCRLWVQIRTTDNIVRTTALAREVYLRIQAIDGELRKLGSVHEADESVVQVDGPTNLGPNPEAHKPPKEE